MSSRRQQRMPVSCENCRRRKIRCLGDGTPCQTCIRRGMSSTCHYLKHQSNRSLQALQAPDASQTTLSPSVVSKVDTLEDLLRENISLTRRALQNSQSQTFSDATPTSSASSEPQIVGTSCKRSGRLIHSATGHVRYVATQEVLPDLSQELSLIDLPFCDRSNTTHQDLLDLLPPLSRCDELKHVFMEVFSPLFHVLHDPTFDVEYATFRQSPHKASLSFLALVFVVIAIGVTALDACHPLLADLGRQADADANMRSIAARFRNAAMRALTADHFLWRHNLQTLQTLVLLIYALSHAHGPAWSLLGTTLNIAIAIGCHVDPSRYDVTKIEAEERRRCWAALLMLYTIQETSLGIQAPMIIRADTQPPTDIDDDELMRSASGAKIVGASPASPSKMAYILHKFKLYHLAADICSATTSDAPQEMDVVRLDQMIAVEETKQEQQFAHLNDLPTYHQAHYLILNSYTNHLYLILHSHVLTKSSMCETKARARSMRRLSDASFTILDNHENLRSTAAFQKYRWYTDGLGSFHAFLAASTLAALYSGADSGRADTQSRSRMVSRVDRCLEHLRSAASRSDLCARAVEVLSRLMKPSISELSQLSSGNLSSTMSYTGTNNENRAVDMSSAQYLSASPSHSVAWAPDQIPLAMPHHDSCQRPEILDMEVDLDGWTIGAEFQNFFDRIPNQQWLSPSVFPWSKWTPNEYPVSPEVLQP